MQVKSGKPMKNKLLNFFYLALSIIILVLILKIVNYIPIFLQKETMRRYNSIEEVKSSLNLKEILIPSYFPNNLLWPPSEIFAQKKPFIAVIMEFSHATNRDIALIISQSYSVSFVPGEKIRIAQVREKVSYPLKGRNLLLEAGICNNEEPCSRITWEEGKHRIIVTARFSAPELIKIVESMLH